MSVEADPTTEPTGEPTARTAARRSRRGVSVALTVVTGLGVLVVVVRDGSPAWQSARAIGTVVLIAGAGWAMLRLGRAGRGLLAFVLGLGALAIGLGIALPHLAKAGPFAMQAAGLVCLLGGLLLAASGVVDLFLTVRGWARVPLVAALLVGTVGVLLTLAPAVAATNVPRTGLADATPADHGLEYRDVSFETVDGVALSGWYVPSRNGAAILLAHGAGSTRSAALPHAVALARRGYGVLLFDARGHGTSGGRAMDFGWQGDEDVGAAVAFLDGRADVRDGRIGALGLSMGGEEVLGAAAANPQIHAVVAEGATVRMAEDKAWLSDEYGLRGWIQEQIEAVRFGLADLLTAAHPPMPLADAVAASAPAPVLLIAAGEVPDEGKAGAHLRRADPDRVEVWEVADAGHTDALRTTPEEWSARVGTFFDRALLR